MNRSHISRKQFVVALGATAAALPLAACSESSEGATGSSESAGAGTLRLGPLGGQGNVSLAAADGSLEEALAADGGTLEVSSSFSAFAPAAEALTAGQIDMSVGSSTSFITAYVGNPDLMIYAIEDNDNDTQGIVAGPGTGITSIADLRGHSVAVNQGGTGDYILRMALESEGMTIDDVEVVYLGPPDALSAFNAGQVDAIAAWDANLVTAESVPGSVQVALANEIGAHNRTVYVVTREFAEGQPELVSAAFDAFSAKADEIAADPSILSTAYVDNGMEQSIADLVVAKRTPTLLPAGADFAAELAEVAQFYADQGLTDGLVDVSDALFDVGSGS